MVGSKYDNGLLDFTQRFHSGINIDDTWRYAGVAEPKSVIIPYLLSLRIREGTIVDRADRAISRRYGIAESSVTAEKATLALADDLAEVKADFVRCWLNWRFFEPSPVPEDTL